MEKSDYIRKGRDRALEEYASPEICYRVDALLGVSSENLDDFLSEVRKSKESCKLVKSPPFDAIGELGIEFAPSELDDFFKHLKLVDIFSAEQLEKARERMEKVCDAFGKLRNDSHWNVRQARFENKWIAGSALCNARPLFNDSGDSVEAFTVNTTLSVAYRRPNEEIDFLNIAMNEDDLNELIDLVVVAKERLNLVTKEIFGDES